MQPQDVVRPLHYSVSVELNPENCSYSGIVCISVEIIKETKILEIQGGDRIGVAEYGGCRAIGTDRHSNPSVTTLLFDEKIEKGLGEITMSYSGEISTCLESEIISTKYNNPEGMEEVIFLSNEKWFPFLNINNQKSTFKFTLTHPRSMMCVANMPIDEIFLTATSTTSHFLKTPIMPVSQLVFTCGAFISVTGTTKSGKLVRCLCPQTIFSKKKTKRELNFALKVAGRSLETYENYFKIRYPLPKLDIVNIPNLNNKQEESLGLVFCRKSLLLNGQQASWKDGVQITKTIVHFTSNQFVGHTATITGDYTTAIKKSLAQYIETFITDELLGKPSQTQPSHTTFTVHKKYESLITLVSALVGESEFRSCLSAHLTRNSFSSVTLTEFWKGIACDSDSSLPVEDIVSSWVGNTSSVIVDVTSDPVCCPHSGQRVISVKQFLLSKSYSLVDSMKLIIPIFVQQADGSRGSPQLLSGSEETIQCPALPFIKLNASQCVPIVVRYTPKLLTALVKSMTFLPEIDQIGILNDSTFLHQSGLVSERYLIMVLSSFKYDSRRYSRDLWSAIEGCARTVRQKHGAPKSDSVEVKRRKRTSSSLSW